MLHDIEYAILYVDGGLIVGVALWMLGALIWGNKQMRDSNDRDVR